MNPEILKKITQKREFSQLPEKDIELAYKKFEKRQASEEEKIELTKKLLREVFSVFMSKKLLSLKNKEAEWILRKHVSTRERLPYYKEIYKMLLKGLAKKISIVDFGAGINGFSYDFFKRLGFDVNYIGVEAVGQLVDLMNFYFKKEKLKAKALHLSLFELEKIKQIVKKLKKPKVIFLFKVIDSLEMLEDDYSKKLLNEIAPIAYRVVVSFATRSIGSRGKFKAKRSWIVDFIKDKFNVLDDFELGGERYVVFESK